MMRGSRMLRRALVLGGLCVVVAAVASVGWAMTSATRQALVACAKKKGGALRLVATAKNCRKTERVVTWNQEGLRGLPGPKGVAGDDGLDGEDGIDGEDGVDGEDGWTVWTASTAPTAHRGHSEVALRVLTPVCVAVRLDDDRFGRRPAPLRPRRL